MGSFVLQQSIKRFNVFMFWIGGMATVIVAAFWCVYWAEPTNSTVAEWQYQRLARDFVLFANEFESATRELPAPKNAAEASGDAGRRWDIFISRFSDRAKSSTSTVPGTPRLIVHTWPGPVNVDLHSLSVVTVDGKIDEWLLTAVVCNSLDKESGMRLLAYASSNRSKIFVASIQTEADAQPIVVQCAKALEAERVFCPPLNPWSHFYGVERTRGMLTELKSRSR